MTTRKIRKNPNCLRTIFKKFESKLKTCSGIVMGGRIKYPLIPEQDKILVIGENKIDNYKGGETNG